MGLLHIYDASDPNIVQTVGARSGDRSTCPISGNSDSLWKALDGLVATNQYFDRILFETHGSAGAIYFGN